VRFDAEWCGDSEAAPDAMSEFRACLSNHLFRH
jgi:hypothetical protein